MSETVYVLGAGVNKGSRDSDNLEPPLVNEFFIRAYELGFFTAGGKEEIKPVFDYIEKYWKLTFDDLTREPFDLESCFTLLQQQRLDKIRDLDITQHYLGIVEEKLSALMTRVMGHFELYPSPETHRLIDQIWEEDATVLTLNYDCVVERAIENKLKYENKGEQWDSYTASVVTFNELSDEFTGELYELDNRDNNDLDLSCDQQDTRCPVVKLHGSLNWFVHTSDPDDRLLEETNRGRSFSNSKDGSVRFVKGFPNVTPDFRSTQTAGVYLLKPLIVTPVLYKNLGGSLQNAERGDQRVIRQSWGYARQALKDCKRLVVIGYSFPPTDFDMQRLFLESFSEASPEEVICINPDEQVSDKLERLCHRTPKKHDDLKKYFGVWY